MKDIIKLHDRKFKIMIPAEKIDEAVSAVAQRINEDYGDKETPLFVGVLNGSFMFMSDLIKKIEFNNELSFVKLASYEGTCSSGALSASDSSSTHSTGRGGEMTSRREMRTGRAASSTSSPARASA